MQNIKKILLALFISFFALISLNQALAAEPSSASSKAALDGLTATAEQGYSNAIPFKDLSVSALIGKFINIALSFVGVIMFVYTVYGGFLYMTASGDKAALGKGKEIVVNNVIGLVIIVSAYALTNFILNTLTNIGGQST